MVWVQEVASPAWLSEGTVIKVYCYYLDWHETPACSCWQYHLMLLCISITFMNASFSVTDSTHSPEDRTPIAGCLSDDGTWASLPARSVWTRLDTGRLFGSPYWPCKRKPANMTHTDTWSFSLLDRAIMKWWETERTRDREKCPDLVASHAMTIEDAHFFVLFPCHVVQALISLHVTDLWDSQAH